MKGESMENTLRDTLVIVLAILSTGAMLSVRFGPIWFLWAVWLLVVLFGVGTAYCRQNGPCSRGKK